MTNAATNTPESSTAGLARPQPLGVFPLPAGYLLVPDGEDLDDARRLLVAGRRPDPMPERLGFYAAALDGDGDAALALLGDTTIDRVNRLVLDPSPERYRAVCRDVAQAADETLIAHMANVGFLLGLEATPPDPAGVDGEFAAMIDAAQATAALERGDRAAAIDHLEAGAQSAYTVSPALAGQLMGQLANVQLDEGGTQRAAITFQAALDLLEGTELYLSRAELHVAAGAMYQEMSEAAPRLMQQAINQYLQATALITADTAPETFAVANANLGLAYLTMPMHEASDQLRMGVAVQAMRDALGVFTPESHPERWSSTQLNLANALVYLPSAHQADNIAEAVDLYEDVLAHRDRDRDPLGRARVLANQGNALAHLGLFEAATARLHEARAIFEEFDQIDAVTTVRSILDEIVKQESQNQAAQNQAAQNQAAQHRSDSRP